MGRTVRLLLTLTILAGGVKGARANLEDGSVAQSMQLLEDFAHGLTAQDTQIPSRFKRDDDGGVTHLDIRDAILQLLKVIRDSSKKSEKQTRVLTRPCRRFSRR